MLWDKFNLKTNIKLTLILGFVSRFKIFFGMIFYACFMCCSPTESKCQTLNAELIVNKLIAINSKFPGVSATIHNIHFDPSLDDFIEKIKAQQNPNGVKVIMNGNGSFTYFSAFNQDKDIRVGGRDSVNQPDQKSTVNELILQSRRIVMGKDLYNVMSLAGGNVAHEGVVKPTILELRDMGRRIPGSDMSLEKELKYRDFKFIDQTFDPKWNHLANLQGTWNEFGSTNTIKVSLAMDRNFLIVNSEKIVNGRIFKFQIDKMDSFEGQWIPTLCQSSVRDVSKKTDVMNDKYEISNIKIGGLSPAQWKKTLTFSKVFDGRTGNNYRVSANGERILVEKVGDLNYNSSFPWNWIYMASVASLLILSVGAYINWKRKQLSKQG